MNLQGKVKPRIYNSVLLIVFIIGCFYVATFAHAQGISNGHFVQGGQYDLSAADTASYTVAFSNQQQVITMQIGNGYSGTTTSAVLGISGTYPGYSSSFTPSGLEVAYEAFTDNTYSVSAGVNGCEFDNSSTDIQGGQAVPYGVIQLLGQAGEPIINPSPDDCVMNPSYYYEVIVGYYIKNTSFGTGSGQFQYLGSPTNSKGWSVFYSASTTNVILPYFALIGNSFTISPTASSSSFDLSGAQAFCNSQFGSSSGISDQIMNGVCLVTGFMFIPSASSISSFADDETALTAREPFSWITQARSLLEDQSASSTDNFINLSLAFGTTTQVLGISTVNVISTTTLSHYLPDAQRNALKGLITLMIYLLAAAYIYRDMQNIWHKQV